MDLLNRLLIIAIMSLFMLNLCNANNKTSDEAPDKNSNLLTDFMAEMWVDGAQMAKLLWLDCSSKATISENDTLTTIERYYIFTACLKKKTLKALDRSLNNDIISIGDGVHLVRYQRVSQNGDLIPDNNTESVLTDKDINNDYWQYLVLKRMAKVLNSHVLKVDLSPKDAISPEVQSQRGRRRMQMMQMMIFGMVSLGMIIIPMGFQFLAVLGGKALLIAKFALILSSIQGLRKIVTSPMNYPTNYGLYQYQQPQLPPDLSNFERRAHPTANIFEKRAHSGINDQLVDTIKYRYNSAAKQWKPEPVKQVESPVYPVYTPQLEETQPTEYLTEYTIDLPVNKLQLKTLQ